MFSLSGKRALRAKLIGYLYDDLSPQWQKMEKHAIKALNKSLLNVFFRQIKIDKIKFDNDISLVRYLIDMLEEQIKDDYKDIKKLQLKFTEYSKRFKYAASDSDKKKHILDFAEQLGANARQLEADKKSQQLWFDHDAVSDRFNFIISKKEKHLCFSLTRLARLITLYILFTGKQEFTLQQWQHLDVEALIVPLFNYKGNEQIRLNAFKLMSQASQSLEQNILHSAFSENIVRYLYRSALDHHQDIWIQTEALGLLAVIAPENFKLVFMHRFTYIVEKDDIFVRHYAVLLLKDYFKGREPDLSLIETALKDSSPYVRQAISKIVPQLPYHTAIELYEKILFIDDSPQVRAAFLLSVKKLINNDSVGELLDILSRLITHEKNNFVLRILMDQIPGMIKLLSRNPELQQHWLKTLFPLMGELVSNSSEIRVRRWASRAREWCWCYAERERVDILNDVQTASKKLYTADHTWLLKHKKITSNVNEVARLLSLHGQNNDGVDLTVSRRGFKIFRKPKFVFRLWRTLYELRHSSIDKRQAYSHTKGRLSRGQVYIPSTIESELSMTKVPGEPFYIEQEDGWRPYLPLVDDVISILDPLLKAPIVKIVSTEGITYIDPPGNPFKRIYALNKLTSNFAYYARLRNWEEGQPNSPDEYIKALEQLGLEFKFEPHQYDYDTVSVEDGSVQRFFNISIPIPFADLLSSFKDYFYSVYENNLNELLIFLTMLISWFLGRHIVINRMISRARKSIGLVVGGWGTRGKSGTERLKAALFNALGFSVVSKTTGCEAMFLHSFAYGQLREMFLFRPYDKATIWEQANVLNLAKRMQTDVFLWECMGLTPSYVEILQRQWMKDDISTITNTYPDHEDLQGPAGHNIPKVMTRFIPKKSVLITTEEQMQPILKKESYMQNSRFVSVGWKEAGLLTDDILARFPYDEHPYNIALVLAMAKELDISPIFALKEMADKVVPDLGVLKTYPSSFIDFRTLTFVMGMSANERYGALGNWRRMGFDKLTRESRPDIWVSVLVNNRADRIPRSRVFADLLINDISTDAIYLIGTNLHGFMGYLKESWDLNSNIYELDSNQLDAHKALQTIVRKFRIPMHISEIHHQLIAMLEGMNEQELAVAISESLCLDRKKLFDTLSGLTFISAIEKKLKNEFELLDSYLKIEKELFKKGISDELNGQLKTLLWTCFNKKIVVIEDEHASGDEIIDIIVEASPPGLENKIMGMQNIKGTGLDFVYRWLDWDYCYQSLKQLSSEKVEEFEQGLKRLAGFQGYSRLCENKVREVINNVKNKPLAQRESFQAELEFIENRMQTILDGIQQTSSKQNVSSRWKLALVNFIEEILDTSDAVKRRKKADLIYKELINLRISYARAALELKNLNTRQKGGWLRKKIFNQN